MPELLIIDEVRQRSWDNKMYFSRFLSRIGKNQNLDQNPGWQN